MPADMHIIQSITLGITQGLSEFLPVSSSGHLILLPWLMKWKGHSLDFDIILHLGTLIALIIYSGQYWISLIKSGIISIKKRSVEGYPERKIFWLVTISTVPSAIIGVLFKHRAETLFRNPLTVGLTMGIFAIIFFIVERLGKKEKKIHEIGYSGAFVIGLLQMLAIVPGISRLGITIISGLALGLKRKEAAEFSFLLSAPVILGAVLLKSGDIFKLLSSDGITVILAGLIVSALCGILAIKYLLSYVKHHNFNIFMVYRVVLSLAVVFIYILRR